MDSSAAIDLGRQAVTLALIIGAPVLLTALAVGFIVSLLQAVTQIQEQTLSLVPKIVATLVAALVFGPWMIDRLTEFARQMFSSLP